MIGPTKTIRAKIATNALPKVLPRSATRGKGDGQPCSGCDAPVEPAHVQYELDFGGGQIIRFHADCERTWRTETGN